MQLSQLLGTPSPSESQLSCGSIDALPPETGITGQGLPAAPAAAEDPAPGWVVPRTATTASATPTTTLLPMRCPMPGLFPGNAGGETCPMAKDQRRTRTLRDVLEPHSAAPAAYCLRTTA